MTGSSRAEGRTLILHGGMHKTGSSAIQEYLYRHLDVPGVEYFCFDRPNSSLVLLEAFHSDLGSLPRYRDRGLSAEDVAAKRLQARRRFQRRLASCGERMLIISAESFCILNRPDYEDLVAQLREHYEQVQLLLYLRPFHSRVESAFQQKLKQRWVPLDDRVVVNFGKQVGNYDAVFGRENVTLRPYDPAGFQGNSVVNDFLQVCGLPLAGASDLEANVGLSLPAVQLLYIYRMQYPQFADEDALLLDALSALPGDRFRIAPALLRKILVERDDNYQWLEQRVGLSLYDSPHRDGREVASESDLLNLDKSTLEWLLEKVAGRADLGAHPSPEAIAVALKTWIVALREQDESEASVECRQ